MPSGVFKPYAGVSTAVHVFQKGGTTDKVWFYDMEADVKELLDFAVEKTGIEHVAVRYRPRLLSDIGFAYVSEELKKYLTSKGMT